MMHDRHLLDWGTWGSALVAAVSLSQAAFALTVLATLLSIILGLIRLHDRIRYGPVNRGGSE